jgi:hypothetical protein
MQRSPYGTSLLGAGTVHHIKSTAYTRFPSWNALAVGRKCKLSAPNPRPTISTALPYRCNRCGTETVRVFKTPMNSNGAPSPARRAVTRPVMRSISEFGMIRIIRERHHNLRSVGEFSHPVPSGCHRYQRRFADWILFSQVQAPLTPNSHAPAASRAAMVCCPSRLAT